MKLRLIEEVDETKLITLTSEWIRQKYSEMNALLFDGKLGDCQFEVFTRGKGMHGNTLGWFKMTGNGIKVSIRTHQMYVLTSMGEKKYITKDNFVSIAKPMIQLNGNYRWTEKSALSTLVHEMCHYYCNMNGFYPRQSHGWEFKSIAARVSAKSDKFFTVERLASAEEMNELVLDACIQAKNDKRKNNKLERIITTLLYLNDGHVYLVNANGMSVVEHVIDVEKKKYYTKVESIKICNDINLKEFIYNAGYKSSMLTYRYWDITSEKALLEEIKKYQFKTVWSKS